MAQINLVKAKKMTTAGELRLVQAAMRPQIAALNDEQLKNNVERARELRDKWRDQAAAQRRTAQAARGSRAAADPVRSRAKAALFAEVLSRFQQELKKARPARVTAETKKAGGADKAQRTRSQRTDRAASRQRVQQQRTALQAERPPAQPPAAQPPSAPAPVQATSPAAEAAPQPALPPSKTARTLAKQAKRQAQGKSAFAGLTLDPANQRSAFTAAKLSRVEDRGLKGRIRGHVSARGKRAQARRDGKGR